MLVVYESALQIICDCPYAYHSSPAGTDFLKVVPAQRGTTRRSSRGRWAIILRLPADQGRSGTWAA